MCPPCAPTGAQAPLRASRLASARVLPLAPLTPATLSHRTRPLLGSVSITFRKIGQKMRMKAFEGPGT